MRAPSIERDGWSLESGEERHAAAPATFWIPSLEARRGLWPGCLVKLIFRIGTSEGVEVERMWVVVTQRIDDGARYLGVLDNTPLCEWAKGRLEPDFELPFEPCHVIDIAEPSEATMALAQAPPARRWH